MIRRIGRSRGAASLVAASLALLAGAWVCAAAAAESFRVVGVTAPDVLNIRSGPSVSQAIVGTAPPDAAGIEGLGECTRGWCHIRYGSVEGWVNARFLRRDAGPGPTGNSEPTPPEPPPAANAPRTVLADGTLEIRLRDGSRLRLTPDGKSQRVSPEGKVTTTAFLQVQTADLPPLPPELTGWGNSLGDDLLTILGNILTSAEMTAYHQTETGKSYYETVQWRLRSIQFLTRPVQ